MDRVDTGFLKRLLELHGLGAIIPAFKAGMTVAGASADMMTPQEYDFSRHLDWASQFEANGFPFSAALLRELASDSGGFPSLTPEKAYQELRRRIDHELETVIFLRVPQWNERFFVGAERFGESTEGAFPSARYDMEEAAKCFALSRYTACVLHLNRVLEVGLNALKMKTGVASHSPTWKAAIDQITKAVSAKAEKDKTPEERTMDAFIREAVHYLSTAKDAIRNPSTHEVERTYTDESAKEVYIAVRAFMRHLATRLSE
jgi:hypothetical protein